MKQDPTAPEIDEEDITFSADSSVIVVEVTSSGSENNYNFSTKLESPDTGCDQYADWWEVITEEGDLVYRRNLGHSHVNEQPFSRSGGPVKVDADQVLIIRGHMNNYGYGSSVMKGSVNDGFLKDTISSDFAIELASADPQPPKCAF